MQKNITEFIRDHKFFKTLLESIPCSVMIVDDKLRVHVINDFLQRAFALDKDSIITKQRTIGDVIRCFEASSEQRFCDFEGICPDCQIMTVAYKALNGGKVNRQRVRIQSIEGQQRSKLELLASASPFEYKSDQFAILLLEDITELTQLRRQAKMQTMFAGLVGQDSKMLDLFDSIEELAQVDVSVLIQGESGTGKELVALAIHREGKRKDKPFVTVNCGAIPETLLESELFGHIRGAFTGATRDKKGRFEMADGGTIFLDELGDISPMMQVKLLRVLQEGTFERVGSEITTKVNVRVISASNIDIQKEVAAGRIREDLYYRLCVVPLYIPPLRERRNDIELLINHFLKEAVVELDREMTVLSPEALKIMMNYNWPGNIRELQNAIKYALVKCKGQVIESHHLPQFLTSKKNNVETVSVKKRVRKRKLNAQNVLKTLRKTEGNKVEASRLLGVSRATLYRFLQDTEIST